MVEVAMFGAGCFWGVEAAFRRTNGVMDTKAGYAGGNTINPTYPEVCSHTTGHAEVVQVKYNPQKISYDDLLNVFWRIHTPSVDHGSQYRSVIFYYSEEQKEQAIKSKERLQKLGIYRGNIVTEILPAGPFYPAEEYHQCYLEKHGR